MIFGYMRVDHIYTPYGISIKLIEMQWLEILRMDVPRVALVNIKFCAIIVYFLVLWVI